MIVSRTPLRISFLGGGTDYPAFYQQHGGVVLSATIDKFCWLTVRRLPPFFEHRNRIVYRTIETTRTVEEIRHPTARAIMKRLGLEGLEVHHDADLPARSGMGTSSAFTVGLLNACHALLGRRVGKMDLARQAIDIEQGELRETVGSQDQVAAAFGGFNSIDFPPNGYTPILVNPLPLPRWRMEELQSHLMLFFTGKARTASEVAESYVPKAALTPSVQASLMASKRLVAEGVRVLSDLGPIGAFGELLHQAWEAKRALSDKVSSSEIDTLYANARMAGAIGGKLLGAGGGGFLLLFVKPKHQPEVRAQLQDLLHVPFRFESLGSTIVLYDP